MFQSEANLIQLAVNECRHEDNESALSQIFTKTHHKQKYCANKEAEMK